MGMEIRAGLHTGEIEIRNGDIGGIAVHIAARVEALASAGEVLVSRTVADLVAGSGIEFEDGGEHDLEGVPGTWRLLAVEDRGTASIANGAPRLAGAVHIGGDGNDTLRAPVTTPVSAGLAMPSHGGEERLGEFSAGI
jgi:hypothetical protein